MRNNNIMLMISHAIILLSWIVLDILYDIPQTISGVGYWFKRNPW